MLEWLKNLFGWKKPKTLSAGFIEKEFSAYPAVSRHMEQNINLWYALYVNHPPWESCEVRPLGLAAAIGRELARFAFTEFSMTVSGGARAGYLDRQMQRRLQISSVTSSSAFAWAGSRSSRIWNAGSCLWT